MRKNLIKIVLSIALFAFFYQGSLKAQALGNWNYGLYDNNGVINSNGFLRTGLGVFPSSTTNAASLELGYNYAPVRHRSIIYGGNLGVSQQSNSFNQFGGQWSNVGVWDRLATFNPFYFIQPGTYTPGIEYLASKHHWDDYSVSIGLRPINTTVSHVVQGETISTVVDHSDVKEAVISFNSKTDNDGKLIFEHIKDEQGSATSTHKDLMALTSRGRLGLGTVSPTAFFQIDAPSDVQPLAEIQTASGVNALTIGHNGDVGINGWSIGGDNLYVEGRQRIKANSGTGSIFRIEDNNGDDVVHITADGTSNIYNTLYLNNENNSGADQTLFIKPNGEVYADDLPTSLNNWTTNGNDGNSQVLVFGTNFNNTTSDIMYQISGFEIGNIYRQNRNFEYLYPVTFGRKVPFSSSHSTRIHSTVASSSQGYLNHSIFSVFDANYTTGMPDGDEIFTVTPAATIIKGSTIIGEFADFVKFGGGMGQLDIDGSIIPAATATHNLGSLAKEWNQGFFVNQTVGTSDLRKKTNIENNTYGMDAIMKMRPVTFEWKENKNGTRIGFIAQEMEEVVPEVVVKDDKDNYGMRYTELIPVLTKGMQEQQAIIEELEQKIDLLTENNKIGLEEQSSIQKEKINQQAVLFQNTPNPFYGVTRIDYFVPANNQSAFIKVTDNQGKLVKAFALKELGYGQVELDCSELASGVYYYSLIINQNVFDTKKMQVTNSN